MATKLGWEALPASDKSLVGFIKFLLGERVVPASIVIKNSWRFRPLDDSKRAKRKQGA